MTDVQRLRNVAEVRFSSVDKKTVDGQLPILLCNYTDVYYNERIVSGMDFMEASATPQQVADFALRSGDVLITKDSETAEDIGISALVPIDLPNVLCGYHLAIVRPRTAVIDGRYLRWALVATSARQQFEVAASGVTRFGLRQEAVGDVRLLVPALPKQRAIADYLDSETARIDNLIAAEQTRAGKSDERLVSAIEAAVLGRSRDDAVVNRPVGPLRPQPEHWEIRRNKTFMREVKELSETGQEELLSVSHLTGVTPRSEKTVNMFLAVSNEGYKRVRPNDLVINTMWAWMGALGVSAHAGIVSPAYGVYRFASAATEPRYFDALFRTPAYVAEMTRYSTGVWTSRLRLYPESFLGLRSPFPPLREQRAIADYVDELRSEHVRLDSLLARSVDLLVERRQALITAAVTGQLDMAGVTA